MSKSFEEASKDFEFLDEMVPYDSRPYMAPSPRLTLFRRGHPVGHLAYEILEGGAQIFGAKLYDVESESRESTLISLVEELARRTHTPRPILSIRKSRRPLSDLWPLLQRKNVIEIPAAFESI